MLGCFNNAVLENGRLGKRFLFLVFHFQLLGDGVVLGIAAFTFGCFVYLSFRSFFPTFLSVGSIPYTKEACSHIALQCLLSSL